MYDETWNAQYNHGFYKVRTRPKIFHAQAKRNIFRFREIPQNRNSGNALSDKGSKRASFNAEAESQYQQVVRDNAHHGTDEHRNKCAVGRAGAADKIVHAYANHLHKHTRTDNRNECTRKRRYLGRCA